MLEGILSYDLDSCLGALTNRDLARLATGTVSLLRYASTKFLPGQALRYGLMTGAWG